MKANTPSGDAYKALDPELFDWVAAMAADGFLTADNRFVFPLSPSNQARFFADGASIGRLYGAR